MFADRNDAGERLARALTRTVSNPLVLGIPRGGVVVARAVADALGAPLDVLVVRKLGAPGNPELAIGAVGPDGSVALDERVIAHIAGLPKGYLEREGERQRVEIARRVARYRGGWPPLEVAGRPCVAVDDGIATGSTARAAIAWLKGNGASPVILAIPVAPSESVRQLSEVADEVVCLLQPPIFYAVGQWYAEFGEVSDDEVVEILRREAGVSGPS